MDTPTYAIQAPSPRPFPETVARVREALAEEGFGIMSEIDVQAKMKEKLGRDMPPYLILGACAPPLAWKVLEVRPDIGVLLPCNVCVYDTPDGTVVAAMEPKAALQLVGDARVAEVAGEVSERLGRVVATVTGPTAPAAAVG